MSTPQQPKQVCGGAFGRFLAEHRAEFLALCKGQRATASVKIASERWKVLPQAEKAPYENAYKKAVETYRKELDAFLAAGGVVSKRKKAERKASKVKKIKDPNRPKKPAGGAFGQFLAAERPNLMKLCAGQPITAVTKLASVKWKGLSDAQRPPYESMYQLAKKAFEDAMKSYVPPTQVEDTEAEAGQDEDEGEEEEAVDEDEEEDGESEKVEPAAKRAKTVNSGAGLEEEAKRLGFLRQFKALRENPNLSAKSDELVIEAITVAKGSAVAAKKALLGA